MKKLCRKCSKPIPKRPNYDAGKFCGVKCADIYRRSSEGIKERFWSRVEKTGGCWLFTGCIGHEGYGSFAHGRLHYRKQYQAHRFAWLSLGKKIPADKLLLHHCDVRHCVNPAHLYVGTRKDNIHDAIRRGRYHHRYTPVSELLWPQFSRRVSQSSPKGKDSA